MKIKWFVLENEENPAFLGSGMHSRVVRTMESHSSQLKAFASEQGIGGCLMEQLGRRDSLSCSRLPCVRWQTLPLNDLAARAVALLGVILERSRQYRLETFGAEEFGGSPEHKVNLMCCNEMGS